MHAYAYAAVAGVLTFGAVAGVLYVVCKQAWKAGQLWGRLNELEQTEDKRLEEYIDQRLLDEVERHKRW